MQKDLCLKHCRGVLLGLCDFSVFSDNNILSVRVGSCTQ